MVAQPGQGERALSLRWQAGPADALTLADGRSLRVVHPGVGGGGAGPDFRAAVLEIDGDRLLGDVELHLAASGWRSHGHAGDPAYATVALHVVEANDTGESFTRHRCGRRIPLLVLGPAQGGFGAPFSPPCAAAVAGGVEAAPILERLSARRFAQKVARAELLVASSGPGQALYALALEQLGGSANRSAFEQLARQLPLAALLERADGTPAARELALRAELAGAAAGLALCRRGVRPAASPERRLADAASLFAGWWPAGGGAAFPAVLAVGPPHRLPGLGRAAAIEVAVNAILPAAVAAGALGAGEAWRRWLALPSPGTYGRLRPLERWLSSPSRPFGSAARLQGGLFLHATFCAMGRCGSCPLTAG